MTTNQIQRQQIAERIDQEVMKRLDSGATDFDVFAGMADHMGDFKNLIDTSAPGEMDRLCAQFEGLYRYAKILEDVARGIEAGDIHVP